MEGYVYHGSPNGDIKEFEPRQSTQKGKYVYATKDFVVAGIFGFKMSSLERSIGFSNKENIYKVIERFDKYFQKNDRPVYIYKLDGKDFDFFEDNSWGEHEVRCAKCVKPLEVIKFESGFEMLKQFEREGKIKLFLYPDKPCYLPNDDFDMFRSVAKIYAYNPSRNGLIFNKLSMLHPEFSSVCEKLKAKMDKMDDKDKMSYAESLFDFKTGKASQELYDFFENKQDKSINL